MDTPLFLAGKQSEHWNECMKHFLQSRRSATTRELYLRTLKDFFRNPLKNPDGYVPSDVLTFLRKPCNSVRNRGGEPTINTQNGRLTALQSFYRFSASYTVVVEGKPRPLLQCPPPTAGLHHLPSMPKPRALSREQLTQFFAAITDRETSATGARNYCLFFCYLILGVRREELLRLVWQDIERCPFFEDGRTREGWRYRVLRKGRPEYEWAEMPTAVMAAILHMLKLQGRVDTIQSGDFIFIAVGAGQNGKPSAQRHLSGNTVDCWFKHYLSKAGLDEKNYSLHSLRHSCAQARYTIRPDLLVLAQAMGWKSLAMAERYLQGLLGTSDPVSRTLTAQFSDL